MDSTTAKIIALCILLLETIICGVVPLCLINCLRKAGTTFVDRILELANLFAGGVFLATLLLYLMPEAAEILKAALEDRGVDIHYPVPEVLVAAGFFLMAITEQLAFCFHHTDEDCTTNSPGNSPHDQSGANEKPDENTHLLSNGKTPPSYHNSTAENELPGTVSDHMDNSCSHDAPVLTHDAHEHLESVVIISPQKTLTIRSLLFFLALSLHSLFEGVAIGLQPSGTVVLEILLAVAIHKGVIAFSFTLSMARQSIITPVVMIYVISLAVISPAGIAIGIVVSETGSDTAADLANGVLQCLASGTFLFVIFFEILPRELHCHKKIDGALNLFFTLIGFGLMAGLQAIGDHDHGHGHDHHDGVSTFPMITDIP